MIKGLIPIFSLTLMICFTKHSAFSQEIMRSTMSSTGTSCSVSFNGHNMLIQQSIGQLSVIGSQSQDKIAIRQGFIQPFSSFSEKIQDSDDSELHFNVYPNPFVGEITLDFQEELKHSTINVKIYDAFSKICFDKDITAKQTLKLNLETLNLPNGVLIFIISSGEKQKVIRLIKNR